MRVRAAAFIVALVSLPTAAGAKPGRFYYNRPGATLVELDGDAKACASQANGRPTIATVGVGRSPASAAANGAMGGLAVGLLMLLDAGKQRKMIDDCLRIKGWRQIVLSDQEATQLETSVREDRAKALTPIVGATTVPVGHLGPAWQNGYAQPHVVAGRAP